SIAKILPKQNHGMFMYLCVCKEIRHSGWALTQSIIKGSISSERSHYGCRYNLQCEETFSAYSSAQSKSDLLKTIIFSSCAWVQISGSGFLNFLGERHIQSKEPFIGCAPEVSTFTFNPASFKALVRSYKS